MNYMDDMTLFSLFKTNKYFRSFMRYDVLWRERTLKIFGHGYIKNVIDCNFYRRLARKSIMYEIPLSVHDGHVSDVKIKFEELSQKALSYLTQQEYILRYGDLVRFEATGTFNYSKLIFDGHQLIPLNYDENKNGVLPNIFHVLTPNQGRVFPVDYWSETMICTDTVWLDIEALGSRLFEVHTYKNESYGLCMFGVNSLCTLIDTGPLVTIRHLTHTMWDDFKNHISQSEKLAVCWDWKKNHTKNRIDFSRVRGVPVYIWHTPELPSHCG